MGVPEHPSGLSGAFHATHAPALTRRPSRSLRRRISAQSLRLLCFGAFQELGRFWGDVHQVDSNFWRYLSHLT